jgi:DNA-directed RNA polymerase specialized sigma24 family protein
MGYYFGRDTDEWIKKYNRSVDQEERKAIFQKSIRPSFEKLIENVIYVNRFFVIDDVETLQAECLSNLFEMLPKFNPDLGKKAFSYFNVIAKNFFIHKYRERQKQNRLDEQDTIKNDIRYSLPSHEQKMLADEFWVQLHRSMESWRPDLKKYEQHVLEAVIFLLRNSELVPIYNKKAVYMYVKDLTGLGSKQVVQAMKKLKGLYAAFATQFHGDTTTGQGEGEEDQ